MKIRYKIYMSIFSSILLLITLVSTTWAWFSVTATAYVDNFNFTVKGPEGFLMSVDNVDYKATLTSDDMKKAILLGKGSDYDSNGDKFEFGLDGSNLVATYPDKTITLDDNQINTYLKNVLLPPITSLDGINFSDIYGDPILPESGKFITFKLYFKVVENPNFDLKYNIYLLGNDYQDPLTKITVPKTSISSSASVIVPSFCRFLDDNFNAVELNGTSSVEVYSSNALRFSIVKPDNSINIYELDDTEASGFGSYASDYIGDDPYLNKLYNSYFNPMFTYYNSVRTYATIKPIDYNLIPNTIKSIDNSLDSARLATIDFIKGDSIDHDIYNSCALSFNFWLEGWDADCIDGIVNSIRVNLSFTSDPLK